MYNQKSLAKGFIPLEPENKKIIKISNRQEENYKIWWRSHLSGTRFEKNMHYYKNENFCVDKDTILKHPIGFYKKLLKSIHNSKGTKEGYYIERSWRYIFK